MSNLHNVNCLTGLEQIVNTSQAQQEEKSSKATSIQQNKINSARQHKYRIHRLDEFVMAVENERGLGYFPKNITKMYIRISDFIARPHLKLLQKPLDLLYAKSVKLIKEHPRLGSLQDKLDSFYIKWSNVISGQYLGFAQRPLDYAFAFLALGLFVRKEQEKFCKVLNIAPWLATFGNSMQGVVIGSLYYAIPNFFINSVGYFSGTNSTLEILTTPDSKVMEFLFAFSGFNIAYDIFRALASPITKRSYPSFSPLLFFINAQSYYLNRKEIIPYFKGLAMGIKDTAVYMTSQINELPRNVCSYFRKEGPISS